MGSRLAWIEYARRELSRPRIATLRRDDEPARARARQPAHRQGDAHERVVLRDVSLELD